MVWTLLFFSANSLRRSRTYCQKECELRATKSVLRKEKPSFEKESFLPVGESKNRIFSVTPRPNLLKIDPHHGMGS
jgi:hypothetical protein